jgi:hypothetical protein
MDHVAEAVAGPEVEPIDGIEESLLSDLVAHLVHADIFHGAHRVCSAFLAWLVWDCSARVVMPSWMSMSTTTDVVPGVAAGTFAWTQLLGPSVERLGWAELLEQIRQAGAFRSSGSFFGSRSGCCRFGGGSFV